MDSSELADLIAFDDLCARIHTDPRLSASTRELALAIAWVLLRDPVYRRRPRHREDQTGGFWLRLHAVTDAGRDASQARTLADGPRYRHMLASDAPRYEDVQARYGLCSAPMIRRDGECGRSAMTNLVEYDPVTGWVKRRWWYCSRHSDLAQRMRVQLRQIARPTPIPNCGGLLPCYFSSDWETMYAWARPRWERPRCGVCADDWPSPGQGEQGPERPRLLLIPGGRTSAAPMTAEHDG